MRWKAVILVLFFLIAHRSVNAQEVAPQIWTNLGAIKVVGERTVIAGEISYNTIVTDVFKWRELGMIGATNYQLKSWMILNGSIDLNYVQQSDELSSFELRPSVGVRLIAFAKRQYNLVNFTRLQLRYFAYSDNTNLLTGRFRNATNFLISLNRNTVLERKNWIAQVGFEVFANFDDDTRERFLNLFRAHIGVGYRFTKRWGAFFRALWQEAQNNIESGEPSQLPITPPDTRWIFEIRFVHTFAPKSGRN